MYIGTYNIYIYTLLYIGSNDIYNYAYTRSKSYAQTLNLRVY